VTRSLQPQRRRRWDTETRARLRRPHCPCSGGVPVVLLARRWQRRWRAVVMAVVMLHQRRSPSQSRRRHRRLCTARTSRAARRAKHLATLAYRPLRRWHRRRGRWRQMRPQQRELACPSRRCWRRSRGPMALGARTLPLLLPSGQGGLHRSSAASHRRQQLQEWHHHPLGVAVVMFHQQA
jgi:hypothetical protein